MEEVPDDPVAVPDRTFILRRIAPNFMVDDGHGGKRVSSAAFQDLNGAMSVGLTSILDDLNLPPETAVERFDGYGLVRFPVAWVRHDQGFGIVHSPNDDEPWHGDVHGKKSKSKKYKFVEYATDWVRRPAVDT